MGLNPRHLKQFQGQRFTTSVIFENIPQICVQVLFLYKLGRFDEATFVAMLSSLISLILSVVDIWSAKQIVVLMDAQQDAAQNRLQFQIATNDEIRSKKSVLMTKPRALERAIAELLAVDHRTVEVYQLLAAESGINVAFKLHFEKYDAASLVDTLRSENKLRKFKRLLSNHWGLKELPQITDIEQVNRRRPTLVMSRSDIDLLIGSHERAGLSEDDLIEMVDWHNERNVDPTQLCMDYMQGMDTLLSKRDVLNKLTSCAE